MNKRWRNIGLGALLVLAIVVIAPAFFGGGGGSQPQVNTIRYSEFVEAVKIASAAPPSGMLPITSPVAGLVTANVPPSMASTHCPLMNMGQRLIVGPPAD